MKHAIVRLTGLLIVLMLVLSGCNLIGVDELKQLDQDFAALKKQYSGVVASYEGGEITQEDAMLAFNSQYSYMNQMYSMYGMSMTAETVTDIERAVVESAVQDVAIAKQIESRGLKLDDEKLAEVEAEAEEHYKEAYDAVSANVSAKTDELKAKQTEYDLYTMGYTKESLLAMETSTANHDLIEQAVRDEITEVTDEELQAAYDEQVKSDEESYSNSPASFENAMSSDSNVVTWMPEGYRTVKHILVKPEDDVLSAVNTARSAVTSAETALESLRSELDALKDDDAEDAEAEAAEEAEPTEAPRTAEEIQADIDEAEKNLEGLKADAEKAEKDCLASVQDKLDEIYGKINGGEDFGALIEEYGEDPGMKNEPTKTRGYYVSSASTTWDQHFTDGAMALENVGDVSEKPVISSSGVHIIRYESDVTPGAVALEDIHDALYDQTLEEKKSDHFTSELDAWVEALKPVYTIENFNLQSGDE